jgi:integrase/recombinase XerD
VSTDTPATAFGDQCRAFEGYLARQGRATGTQLKYGQALEFFGVWLDGRSPAALACDEIDQYLQSWQSGFVSRRGRLPSSATYRAQISALRAFYAWLERFDYLRDLDGRAVPNPMRRITAPAVEQRANDWLRPHEDRALLGVDCNGQERIILQLLRWSGLRVGEATSLVVADIDLTPGEESLAVRHSKTAAGRRMVPIVPALRTHVRSWLHVLEGDGLLRPDAPVLCTSHGSSMKASYIWRVVKRLAFRADVRVTACMCGAHERGRHEKGCPRSQSGENLSSVSPHTLRRTFGSDLLNRGLRLEVVSRLLGHASTTVTERAYAEMLYETARRELFEALAPSASYN